MTSQLTTALSLTRYPDMILSASRDKSLIVWKLTRDDIGNYGIPQVKTRRSLRLLINGKVRRI